MRLGLFGPIGPCLCAVVAWSATATAQDRFATTIVDFQQGPGGGLFDPAALLGGPRGLGFGAGSLDVLTLGVGGQVTLGFDVTITNGPGADFLVFENGFEAGGGLFAEVAFVEVSTNGTDFARMPTRYNGAPGPFPPLLYGTFSGLAGGIPVLANVDTNEIDPFDPVVAGGEAFDLAELRDHPLVTAGTVDLQAIHYVRLVDMVEGTDIDSEGTVIWDAGAADFDAVAVIHHTGNQSPSGPRVKLSVGPSSRLQLTIHDPDGIADLDMTTRSVSFNLRPMSFRDLRRWFRLQLVSDDTLHLVSRFPASAGPRGVLAVSIRDLSGAFSADQISLRRPR